MVPEPFTVKQRHERALHDAAKKALCHRRRCLKRTAAAGKNLNARSDPHAENAGQGDEI